MPRNQTEAIKALNSGDQLIRGELQKYVPEANDPYFAVKQVARLGDLFDKHMAPTLRELGATQSEIAAARTDYGALLRYGKPEPGTIAPDRLPYETQNPGAMPELFQSTASRDSFVAPDNPALFATFGQLNNSVDRRWMTHHIIKATGEGFAGGASAGLVSKAVGAGQLASSMFGDKVRESFDQEFLPQIYGEAYLQSAKGNIGGSAMLGEFVGRAVPDLAGGLAAQKLAGSLGTEALKTSARGGFEGWSTRMAGRMLEGGATAAPAALTEIQLPGETPSVADVAITTGAGMVAEGVLGGLGGYLFDQYGKRRLANAASRVPVKEAAHRIERAVFEPDSLVTATPKGLVELQKTFPFLKINAAAKRGYRGSVSFGPNADKALTSLRRAEKDIADAVSTQYDDILKPTEKTVTDVLNRTAKPDVSGIGPTPAGVDINDLTNMRNSLKDLGQRFDSGFDTIAQDSPVIKYVDLVLNPEARGATGLPDYVGFGEAREIQKVLGGMSVDESLSQAERKVAGRLKHAIMNDYEDAIGTLAQRADLSEAEAAALGRVQGELRAANRFHSQTLAVFQNSKDLNSSLRDFLNYRDAGGKGADQLTDVIVALGEASPEYAKKMIKLANDYQPGFENALQRATVRRAMRTIQPEDVPGKSATPTYANLGDIAEITNELGSNPKFGNIFDEATQQKLRIVGRAAKAAEEHIGKAKKGSRAFAQVRGEGLAGRGGKPASRFAETDFRAHTEILEQLPLWLNTAQGQRALAEIGAALPTEANALYNGTRVSLALRDFIQVFSATATHTAGLGGQGAGTQASEAGAAAARRAEDKGQRDVLEFLLPTVQFDPSPLGRQ